MPRSHCFLAGVCPAGPVPGVWGPGRCAQKHRLLTVLRAKSRDFPELLFPGWDGNSKATVLHVQRNGL